MTKKQFDLKPRELSPGMRFNKLTVVRPAGRDKHFNAMYLCKCSCGNETSVRGFILLNGNTKSCGCLRRKHGHTSSFGKRQMSPTYRSWDHMLNRCTNKNSHSFKNYGGRGITVCERWMKFENFLEDMGIRPDGLTLDRTDNELGYFPENCRWATWKVQNNNRRNNISLQRNPLRRPQEQPPNITL